MNALLSLPAVQALIEVLGTEHVRLVGGCVRDQCLGLPPRDIDACTPLKPQAVLAKLQASTRFHAIPTGLQHGTITAVFEAQTPLRTIEVTTLRHDEQTDGRHAQVAFTKDWRGDAARRDFTFNALSLDSQGQIHDYFDGRADLAAGRVRFIGDARARLAEDWLRGLRYFRFWGRFGTQPPTEQERVVLSEAAQHLDRLSCERIWSELRALAATPRALAALRLLEQLGFTQALDFTLDARVLALREDQKPDPVALWAGLAYESKPDMLKHLRASSKEQAHFSAVGQARASGQSLFAQNVCFGTAAAQAVQMLAGARTFAPVPPPFPLSARDLLALGAKPGPPLGRALDLAKNKWIEAEGALAFGTLRDLALASLRDDPHP